MERQVTQVKTFGTYVSTQELDRQVNGWLYENANIVVLSIIPAVGMEPILGTHSCRHSYLATIVYKGEVSQ